LLHDQKSNHLEIFNILNNQASHEVHNNTPTGQLFTKHCLLMYSVKNASGKKSPKPNLAKSNIEQINTFLQLINLPKLYFMYNCNVLLNANFFNYSNYNKHHTK